MTAYQHILLTTDLTGFSKAAEDKALELAKQFKARLSLVHIVEPIPAYAYPGFADLETPILDQAKEQLAAFGARLQIAPVDQHIEFGSVKAQVVEIADKLNADLIIIGSHGRHGLGLLLGSSAHAIVNHAHCDVLTVRCVSEE
jgi:universal stress protein A